MKNITQGESKRTILYKVGSAERRVRAAADFCPIDNSSTAEYFASLMSDNIVLPEEWKSLQPYEKEIVHCSATVDQLHRNLAQFGLLNKYQVDRLRCHRRFGLVIGNYRVLAHLGTGGMGVIYLGEHIRMKYRVAIKTLNWANTIDDQLICRFYAEVRAVGDLQHPNIVSALDAGSLPNPDPDGAELHYFVMEYLAGQDLDSLIRKKGALPVEQACKIAHQMADALSEAHRIGLVHRDIKPSNVFQTFEGLSKLLDFGLARNMGERLTVPGTVLGTVGYMSPEQAKDASSVDFRSDIYSLGATLYWCLAGKDPFPNSEDMTRDLVHRLTKAAPSIRTIAPHVPVELDRVLQKMMAVDPADRHADAKAVMKDLMPFLRMSPEKLPVATGGDGAAAQPAAQIKRILVVDDDKNIRAFSKMILHREGYACEEAEDGAKGLEIVCRTPFDLVLLDIQMPNMNGLTALKEMRQSCPNPNLKIIMFSGDADSDELAKLLASGADDFLQKPFSIIQFRSRVKAALKQKEAQDRSEMLNRQLLNQTAELEKNLMARDSDLVLVRNTLILTLADLVEGKCTGSRNHLRRMQQYVTTLGTLARDTPRFSGQVNDAFMQALEACAPLHDIGNSALPDHIMLKPGKLTPDEIIQMQAHTVIGADTLRKISDYNCFSRGFLQMAIDIARHHHERFDGSGYPDGLSGTSIPLSARIVAIADVYDAMRSPRSYKPAIQHNAVVRALTDKSSGHFDPALVVLFQECSSEFEKIYATLPG